TLPTAYQSLLVAGAKIRRRKMLEA
ncbi:MAG: hypothetical protein K0S16_2005, partial [Moraxellaceae bacterium]|nr:hypothetical protein [Moraxellaceae bacterium]